MWLIPGKTKVQTEIFKGVSIADILIGIVSAVLFALLLLSNLPYKFVFSIVLLFITVLLLIRIDEEPPAHDYVRAKRIMHTILLHNCIKTKAYIQQKRQSHRLEQIQNGHPSHRDIAGFA